MKITVTKGHFDKAVKHSKNLVQNCLIAQAFKSAFPRKRVEVTYHAAHVGGIGSPKQRLFNVPKNVGVLIGRFDSLAYIAAETRTKREATQLMKLRASLPRTFEMKELLT